MNKLLLYWILLLLLCFTETLSATSMKYFVKHNNNKYFAMSILGYVLVGIILYYSLKLGKLSITYAIWNSVTIILTSLIAILFFKEKLNKYNIIGIILAILSVILINYS